MFGLSTREMLIKMIKNACQNNLQIYRQGIEALLEQPEEDHERYAYKIRKKYFNAVFDSIWNYFGVSSPSIDQRLRLVLMSPEISGLPPEFPLEYLDTVGISAGVAFAFCYYAITNKPVSTVKLSRDMSMLNHYQLDCMNRILAEYS